MSVNIYGTLVFIDLYNSGLISDRDWNEFYQQTRHLEDDEEIAEAIEVWLKTESSRQPILQAYQEKLDAFFADSEPENGLMGPAKSKSSIKPNQLSSRQLLDNAIQRRPKPLPETPPKKP